MQQLKSAIEFTHERVETQSAALEAHGHQFAEQTAVNMKLFKGLAEAKGDLTQHKIRCETFHADIQTAVPGPGLMDMMKDMYDSGDDKMKKMIGETMTKQRNGELDNNKNKQPGGGLGAGLGDMNFGM